MTAEEIDRLEREWNGADAMFEDLIAAAREALKLELDVNSALDHCDAACQQARDEAYERAAQLCDEEERTWQELSRSIVEKGLAGVLAERIRSLKSSAGEKP